MSSKFSITELGGPPGMSVRVEDPAVIDKWERVKEGVRLLTGTEIPTLRKNDVLKNTAEACAGYPGMIGHVLVAEAAHVLDVDYRALRGLVRKLNDEDSKADYVFETEDVQYVAEYVHRGENREHITVLTDVGRNAQVAVFEGWAETDLLKTAASAYETGRGRGYVKGHREGREELRQEAKDALSL